MKRTDVLYYMKDAATGTRERIEFKNGRPTNVPANYEGKFYMRVSEGDKRVWLKFNSIDDASLAQDQKNREHRGMPSVKTADVAKLLAPAPAKGTIAAAAEKFISETEPRIQQWRDGSKGGLAPNTVVVIKDAIKTFLEACQDFGAVNMADFQDAAKGRAIVMHFLDWMRKNTDHRDKGKKAYTYEKKFTYVAQLLGKNHIKAAKDKKVRWDGDPGLLEWHEVPRAQRPKGSDVVFYSVSDLEAMWDAAGEIKPAKKGVRRSSYTSEDIKDLMCVLALTGMRDEEVQHLQWDDVIWANGDGLPKFKVTDKPQYDWKPKNGERTVEPIGTSSGEKSARHFLEALRDRLKARRTRHGVTSNTTLVFPTTVGTPDQNFADQIRKMHDQAVEEEDYEFNRPEAHENIVHNFRRTFATVLNSCYGLSGVMVQHRIGDGDLDTTQRYLGLVDDPQAMRKAFEALPLDARPVSKVKA